MSDGKLHGEGFTAGIVGSRGEAGDGKPIWVATSWQACDLDSAQQLIGKPTGQEGVTPSDKSRTSRDAPGQARWPV